MNSVVRPVSVLAVAVMVAGCAQLRGAPEPVMPAPPEVPDARAITAVLAGEIAARRGDFASAAGYYLAAARLTQDAEVAAQATRIALVAKDLERAEKAAQVWVKADPDSVAAHEVLARTSLRHGDSAAAATAVRRWMDHLSEDRPRRFRQAAALIVADAQDPAFRLEVAEQLAAGFPDEADARLMVAHVALDSDRSERALVVAEELLETQPEWVDALLIAVRARLRQADADVQPLVDTLHRVRPEDVDLRMHLSRLMLDAERFEAADAEFASILELESANSSALMGRGLLAMDRGDVGAARHWFSALYEAGERDDDAAYYLGLLEEREGNPVAAAIWYQRVHDGERRYEAALRRARLMGRAGQVDAARGVLANLRTAFPRHRAQTYAAEGEILYEAGAYADAVAVFDEALEDYPQQPDLLYGRALNHERLGQIDRAEADLRAMIEINRQDSRALNALGYVLSNHTERYREALELVERALALEPDDPAIIDSLGWLQFKLGRLDEAVANLRDAHRRFPDPEVAAHLGEALWVSGRREEAVEVWRQALQTDPDHPVLVETLQRLKP